MDYISELPVKIVEDATPLFDEVVQEKYNDMLNSSMRVELLLPGLLATRSNHVKR